MKLKVPASAPANPPPSTEVARIQRLRDWIVAAERDGSDKADLVLRLTYRDGSALKRHPSVQAAEITFASGAMHFLGVRVEEGSVTEARLELGETPPTT